ncbi:MAG: hypothetical protein JSS14_27985 [Proteobacteria bacterium]|nr:hypothetical protein [Pseudomonadota bacterium]
MQLPALEHYLALAIRQSGALTPRGEAVLADYLQQFAQAPGVPLGEAQARAKDAADLALNIRAAELLRAPLSPRRPLATFAGELHRSALLQKARFDAVATMREFCAQMSLTLANTGEECAWCRENEGRSFSVMEDPNELLARHCACTPHAWATFHPAIQAFDA